MRGGVGEYLKKVAFQITRYHPEIEIIEINTDVDHMHVLISIPPKMPVSDVVRILKANTGKKLRERFPHLVSNLYENKSNLYENKSNC